MRRWFGVRRAALKTHYAVQRVRARVRALLHIGPSAVPFEQVQRRLELVLSAVYGRAIPIAPIERGAWNRERVRQLLNAMGYEWRAEWRKAKGAKA